MSSIRITDEWIEAARQMNQAADWIARDSSPYGGWMDSDEDRARMRAIMEEQKRRAARIIIGMIPRIGG